MKKWKIWGLAMAMSSAGLFVGCKSLTCGSGTKEKEGACVVAQGLGGAGGAAPRGTGFSGVHSAGPVSATSLMAAWHPVEDEAVSYNIYLATSEDGFNYVEPQARAPAGAQTAVIGNLEEEGTYFVQVRAVIDGEGEENDATAEVTLADDTELPSFAGVTKVEPAAQASAEVFWEPASDDLTPDDALLYVVYAGETEDEIDLRLPVGVSLPGATSTVVSMPRPETEYFFVVRARDAAGNSDENEKPVSGQSGTDEVAPTFAGCRAVTARTASSLVATWDPAEDDVAVEEEIVYNLYASETVDGFNFEAPDATVTDGETTGVIPGLDRSTQYFVICRAMDPSQNEEPNEVVQQATTLSDDVPPDFPGPITVSAVGTTTATLSWPAATDNKSASKDLKYFVYLSETKDGFGFETEGFDFERDAFLETDFGQTKVELEGLDSNTSYFAVVLARDEGEVMSVPGEPLAFTTPVSFQLDVLAIFSEKKCATAECHGGAAPVASLNLSSALAYDALVGVAATTAAGDGFLRVEADNAADSHLVHRIKGTGPLDGAEVEQLMPNDGNLLSDEQIATIELWITEGAKNN